MQATQSVQPSSTPIQPDIVVRLDDRVRLLSTLLAATDWNSKAQARHLHGIHTHARGALKLLAPYRDHDAVRVLQERLDKNTPLEALFSAMLRLRLPDFEVQGLPGWMTPEWIEQLRDLYQRVDLPGWWQKDSASWQAALDQSKRALSDSCIRPFLEAFVGDIRETLVFVPNIAFPTDQEVGVRLGRELIAIVPPRLAWGDSPPWPFDDDAATLYRAVLTQFGRMLMVAYLHRHADKVAEASKIVLPVPEAFQQLFPGWQEQFLALFVAGIVAIYLEDHVSPAEANAFVLMERKVYGMALLPGVISVLRRYLTERQAGRYSGFADFLPMFPKQVRVARRIVSL